MFFGILKKGKAGKKPNQHSFLFILIYVVIVVINKEYILVNNMYP
nr:MAG TPA: hypothetical protein [Caudoviricetes sp.]